MARWETKDAAGLPVGTIVQRTGHKIGGIVADGTVAWMDEDPKLVTPDPEPVAGEVDVLTREPSDTDEWFLGYVKGYLSQTFSREMGIYEFIAVMDRMAG